MSNADSQSLVGHVIHLSFELTTDIVNRMNFGNSHPDLLLGEIRLQARSEDGRHVNNLADIRAFRRISTIDSVAVDLLWEIDEGVFTIFCKSLHTQPFIDWRRLHLDYIKSLETVKPVEVLHLARFKGKDLPIGKNLPIAQE